MEIGTEHNRASETTMLTVALPIISMDSSNGHEDISITSAVMQGDIENNVESLTRLLTGIPVRKRISVSI